MSSASMGVGRLRDSSHWAAATRRQRVGLRAMVILRPILYVAFLVVGKVLEKRKR